MSTSLRQIAEAFSSHRFTETFPHLAPDVRWVSVGGSTVEGRDAVVDACTSAATELADVTTDFTRFLTVVGTEAVTVDAVGRYVDPDGQVSVVSSCDVYEFTDGVLATITSYAVELPTG
jgi:ketosteroid isomerase-like protein